MKKLLILLIILLCGCDKDIYEQITAKEAYKMITDKETIILDVREDNEYKKGHLKNSINIPFDELEERFIKEVTDNKNKIIIVYCQSGNRSMIAAEILSSLGFNNIYTFGSIDDWNYEIIK